MISWPKKLLVSFLTLLTFFPAVLLTAAIPASAQAPNPAPTGTWYNPSLQQFRDRVVNSPPTEIFGERYTFAQVIWIIRTLQLEAVPNIQDEAVRDQFELLLGNRASTPNLVGYAKLGAAGILAGTISDMYANPVSSARTEVNALAAFDLASPVSAQGYGFGATTMIRPLWSAARNSAYLVMVILLVAAGFMVMFRVKINPQTAVTLQLMIPKIIITLIAITFSYAIAGLVIDLVYAVVGFVIYMVSSASGVSGSPITNAGTAISFFGTPGFTKFFFLYLIVWLTFILGEIVSLDILGAIFGLIMTIVVLFLLFKVWWMLLKTYVSLILSMIIAPWQIMLGLLPGGSGFSSWLRNFIAQASVFAVVPLMFLLSVALMPPIDSGGIPILQWLLDLAQSWATEAITGVNPGVLSGGTLPDFPIFGPNGLGQTTNVFRYMIVFGILAIIPKTAEMVKEALKVPAFKYGTAFGEAITGPINATTQTAARITEVGKIITSRFGTKP